MLPKFKGRPFGNSRSLYLMTKDPVDGASLVRLKCDPKEISGKAIAFALEDHRSAPPTMIRRGFILATGTREAAALFLCAGIAKPGGSEFYIRLKQDQVDRIKKAAVGMPFEFTCYP